MQVVSRQEVILRDFDGSRTVYPVDPPLRNVIHSEQSDGEVRVSKTYVRTEEKDEAGRIIYDERR